MIDTTHSCMHNLHNGKITVFLASWHKAEVSVHYGGENLVVPKRIVCHGKIKVVVKRIIAPAAPL